MNHRFATKQQRRTLLIIQEFRCALCGCELAGRFDCDHIVPVSLGGKTVLSNLQALCKSCHIRKNSLDGSRPQTRACEWDKKRSTNFS